MRVGGQKLVSGWLYWGKKLEVVVELVMGQQKHRPEMNFMKVMTYEHIFCVVMYPQVDLYR